MKKVLTSLLAGISMLAVLLTTGCNSSSPASQSTLAGVGSASGEQASSNIKIGFTISSRDQFLSSLESAMLASAKEKGVELTVFDAQQDTQKQLEQVATFASQNFNAIIVNLVDTNITEGVVKAAGTIPVVFVNRMPDSAYLVEGQTATVGSDEYMSGGLQAEFLADYFKDKAPKELNIVVLMGTLGLQHTTARTESAKKGLEDAGFKVNVVFEDTADFDRSIGMEKMQQFLGTGKDFDAVICNNDEMALGVIEAMRAVGVTDKPVVGIDATDNAKDAVEKGELACTVFQNAVGQGEGAIDVAYRAATGELFESENWIPFELVTIDNLNDFK